MLKALYLEGTLTFLRFAAEQLQWYSSNVDVQTSGGGSEQMWRTTNVMMFSFALL